MQYVTPLLPHYLSLSIFPYPFCSYHHWSLWWTHPLICALYPSPIPPPPWPRRPALWATYSYTYLCLSPYRPPSASDRDPSTLPTGNRASHPAPLSFIPDRSGSPQHPSLHSIRKDTIASSILDRAFLVSDSLVPLFHCASRKFNIYPSSWWNLPIPDIDPLRIPGPIPEITCQIIDVPQGSLVLFLHILHLLPCPLYPTFPLPPPTPFLFLLKILPPLYPRILVTC